MIKKNCKKENTTKSQSNTLSNMHCSVKKRGDSRKREAVDGETSERLGRALRATSKRPKGRMGRNYWEEVWEVN